MCPELKDSDYIQEKAIVSEDGKRVLVVVGAEETPLYEAITQYRGELPIPLIKVSLDADSTRTVENLKQLIHGLPDVSLSLHPSQLNKKEEKRKRKLARPAWRQ